MQVWGLVGRSPFPPSSSGIAREGSRRIPTADALLLRKAGTIEDAFPTITGGWIMPLSVVEEKTTGSRRRWIAWPRDKNRDDPYEANAPLLNISHYLPPVMAEAASCLDLKESFFSSLFAAGDSASLSMPRGGRHAGGAGTAPSGIQGRPGNSPDYYCLGNCGGDDGGSSLWAAPPSVRVDVWIDDIRIAGSKSDVTLWEAQVLRNADSCHATIGEDRESGATQYTFLGVQFDHTHRAVSLSDKFVRSVRAMPALNSLTIAENGGCGVTLFVRGCHFGHAFMRLLLFYQGNATKIIRT
ncbi:putative target of rapamycin (TOR) kinase 1 [Trypanosoma cruzi]|uniref:Putative target of rapamycin (TOR) kinase 1 n=1 Tax=Trypanosoma cruzi TaxID=5693 RepID=A0A2V2WLB7_TRYCR|nr:putative target of rapamycin (TOR) kinase 1 [Trypanosoma cruzi]